MQYVVNQVRYDRFLCIYLSGTGFQSLPKFTEVYGVFNFPDFHREQSEYYREQLEVYREKPEAYHEKPEVFCEKSEAYGSSRKLTVIFGIPFPIGS